MVSITDSKKHFKTIQAVLNTAAKANLNVLLRGESGVGKTHMVMDIADSLGLRLKYFSASTLDPFADLIGIPAPKDDHVEYLRLEDINTAEFMFFDELNRSHKRVMNAVLEIIQFKTLNGDKLENLKMVWAAVNPWEHEGYQTETLDLALQGRFHFNIDVPYNLSFDYFAKKYNEDVAKVAYEWWWGLSDNLRTKFQPRRLDYTIDAIIKDLHYEYTAPFDVALPLESLKKSVLLSLSTVKLADILNDNQKFIKIIRTNDMKNPMYVDAIRTLTSINNDATTVARAIPVICELPADYMSKIIVRNNNYKEIRQEILSQYGLLELLKWDQQIQQKINS